MPFLSNPNSTTGTTLVCARPGDTVKSCIKVALALVAEPGKAYAYFDHNGVIVTVDKSSTPESAYADWKERLSVSMRTWRAAG